MAPECTICCDDEVKIIFLCPKPSCAYQLCRECLLVAFNDHSGQNSRKCLLCKTPTAKEMLIAQIGKGGVRAVEEEIRPSIENEVRKELTRKEESKKAASEISKQALKYYNDIVEMINLKCPRCNMAFYDYDGCNALKCGNDLCQASFCAICLKDCGTDAHPHVRKFHGNLFDKDMFYSSKRQRTSRIVDDYVEGLKETQSSDLVQLVTNQLQKGEVLVPDDASGPHSNAKAITFLRNASADLERMACCDRISVIKDDDSSWKRQGISHNHVSPRSSVPEDICLLLTFVGRHEQHGEVFEIRLFVRGRPTEPEKLQEMMKQGLISTSSTVLNIQQSLRCAVVAFEGERCLFQTGHGRTLGPTKISLRFFRVDQHGRVASESHRFVMSQEYQILGLNGNQRLTLLQSHIESIRAESIPTALKHLVGIGNPVPVLDKLVGMTSTSLDKLNENQRTVAHPLLLKTANEVAGPPGTGKTQVISTLVREILNCSDKSIVVLSERNGAIDAVAEKFLNLCFQRRNGELHKLVDLDMWKNILTFGSKEAMGKHTKEFLVDEKMKWHPDIVAAKSIEYRHQKEVEVLSRKIRDKVSEEIKSFGDKFDDDNAWNHHRVIEQSFKNPKTLLDTLRSGMEDLVLLQSVQISEDTVKLIVSKNPEILEKLFAIPRDENTPFDGTGLTSWNRTEVSNRMKDITKRFRHLLDSDLFNLEHVTQTIETWKAAQENRKKVEVRVRAELERHARLKMSTIGSSHRLFVPSATQNDDSSDDDDEEDDLIFQMENLDLEKPGTIVIFDESGCIPSYELLGLDRLDCNVDAIYVVGDKHQLPPYDPSSNARNNSSRNKRDSFLETQKLKSLLDVSQVKETRLTVQYRVPRDIADILNARIYDGNYHTIGGNGMVSKGLSFVHVNNINNSKKYVNPSEVERVLDMIREKSRASRRGTVESLMILTPVSPKTCVHTLFNSPVACSQRPTIYSPLLVSQRPTIFPQYKKQQREIQFQIKRRGLDISEDRVLTIDQCQGQEADTVFLSLVQKPTRFLNKNRLNVALSRTRNELYIVGDRDEFTIASSNRNWECAFMAQDILHATM